MRVRNKEHQSLGINELKQLSEDFTTDAELGREIRRIIKDKQTKEVFEYYEELQKHAT